MKCQFFIFTLIGALSVFAQPVVEPDAYEPNNSFDTPYTLSFGDSVIKNATVYGSVGFDDGVTIGTDIDADVYKVTLQRGTILSASAFMFFNGTSEDTNTAKWRWRIFVCDTAHVAICGGTPVIEYFEPGYTGTYYLVVTSIPGLDYACRYGISISQHAIISRQTSNIPDTCVRQDTSGYHMTVNLDTANISVNLTMSKKVDGSISAKMLVPSGFDTTSIARSAIKTISITADDNVASSLKSADIVIPYSQTDLSGVSENSLKVMYLDDTTNKWSPVDCTIDTVNNKAIAHTTHFSIYGLFAEEEATPVISAQKSAASISNVKASYVPSQRSITLCIAAPKAGNAEYKLFTVQGKCIGSGVSSVKQGVSSILWNIGNLAVGTYICKVNTGDCQYSGSVSVIR